MKKLSLILGAIALVLIAMLTLGCENAAEGDTKIEYRDKEVPAGSIAPTIDAIHVLSSSAGSTKLLVVLDPATVSGSTDPSQFDVTITGVHDEQVLIYDSSVTAGKWGTSSGSANSYGIYTLVLGAEVGSSDKITIETYGYSATGETTKKSKTIDVGTVTDVEIPETVTLNGNTLTAKGGAGTAIADNAAVIYKLVMTSNTDTGSRTLVTPSVKNGVATFTTDPAAANTTGVFVWNGVLDDANASWDKVKPVLSNVKVTRTGTAAATIAYDVDEAPATNGYGFKVGTTSPVSENVVYSTVDSFTGLSLGETAATDMPYVKVQVKDSSGNESDAVTVQVKKYNAATITLGAGQYFSTGLSASKSFTITTGGMTASVNYKVTGYLTDKYNRTISSSETTLTSTSDSDDLKLTFTAAKLNSLAVDSSIAFSYKITATDYETVEQTSGTVAKAATVTLAGGSQGTAADKSITGLTATSKYLVQSEGTWYVVKADGTLDEADDLEDAVDSVAVLTGTAITGLENGATYDVYLFTALEHEDNIGTGGTVEGGKNVVADISGITTDSNTVAIIAGAGAGDTTIIFWVDDAASADVSTTTLATQAFEGASHTWTAGTTTAGGAQITVGNGDKYFTISSVGATTATTLTVSGTV